MGVGCGGLRWVGFGGKISKRVKGNWEGEGSHLDRIESVGSMEVGQISKWMCCDTVSVLVRDVSRRREDQP